VNRTRRRLAKFPRVLTQRSLHAEGRSRRWRTTRNRASWNREEEKVSQQTLSTGGYGPVLRRALLKAIAVSLAIVGVATGPALVRNWRAVLHAAARPIHAPRLALLVHAPLAVQLHLATLAVAATATVVLLAGVKGTRLHRTLGWTWACAMLATAISTLFIKAPPQAPNIFGLGYLHLFALLTFISVPRAVWAARRHLVEKHAGIISGFLVGGLGLAGLFALMPGRLMWQVLFS
jgi:uncharacterized membrane protein